jgi:Uma2 family endonuclease
MVVQVDPTERRTSIHEQAEPTWEIAYLFPSQGNWTVDDYLALDTNHLIEFSHGYLEVLEMPTTTHQVITAMLYRLLAAFVELHDLGLALMSPLPIRLWEDKFREPDVVFLRKENLARLGEQFWDGADLAMEVISPDSRTRDRVKKRREYALAGIQEFWLIDPEAETIIILQLEGKQYAEHGVFKSGDIATSALLPGFAVDVAKLFASAQIAPKN